MTERRPGWFEGDWNALPDEIVIYGILESEEAWQEHQVLVYSIRYGVHGNDQEADVRKLSEVPANVDEREITVPFTQNVSLESLEDDVYRKYPQQKLYVGKAMDGEQLQVMINGFGNMYLKRWVYQNIDRVLTDTQTAPDPELSQGIERLLAGPQEDASAGRVHVEDYQRMVGMLCAAASTDEKAGYELLQNIKRQMPTSVHNTMLHCYFHHIKDKTPSADQMQAMAEALYTMQEGHEDQAQRIINYLSEV